MKATFMDSNDKSSFYGAQSSRSYRQHHREPVVEQTIRSEQLQVERKSFELTLRENSRGRFLRITEDGKGRRDCIIIPASGLEDFADLVSTMADIAAMVEDGPGEGDAD